MTTTDTNSNEPNRDRGRGRDVVVPTRLYKTVTVFSTLLAMVGVVGGFALLDVATRRASAPASEVNVPLALLGLAVMGGGGAVYAYATRFRASGMGASSDASASARDDEPNGGPDDG